MKLKVLKKLAAEGCKPVASILGKDGLSEMGRYIVVEADKEGLSYSVHRSDIVGKSVILSSKVPTVEGKSLLDISEPGRFVTNGDFLLGLLFSNIECDLDIDFDDAAAKKKDKKEEGELPELQVVGTAKVTSPNLKVSVGCVEDRVPKMKDFDPKNKVMFKASTLSGALAEAGVAAGKSTMNQDYTGVKIIVSGGKAEIVSTNGQQLAIIKVDNVDGFFTCVAPFEMLTMAVAGAYPGCDVQIVLSKDERNLMVGYPLVYGGQEVGSVEYQLPVFDWFPKYEKKIKNISALITCRVLTEHLRAACSVLSVVDPFKTFLKIQSDPSNPGKGKIIFQKAEARGSIDSFEIPVENIDGKDFEVWISARHLEAAVAKADKEYVDLVFTGRTSVCKIQFPKGEQGKDGRSFEQYFAPFTEA